MTTAILKAEVQTRIDAITHPTDPKLLVRHAADTVALDLDLTNIISVTNAGTAAITSATSSKDLTLLHAASIALGITSKSISPIKPMQRGYFTGDIVGQHYKTVNISSVDMSKTEIDVSGGVYYVADNGGMMAYELYSSTQIRVYNLTSTQLTFKCYWQVKEYV